MQRAFDVGQVARMLGISNSLVTKWMQQGKLPFYKIPFTGRKKVRYEDMQKFCRDNGLEQLFEPLRPLSKWIKRKTILVCGCDPSLSNQLTQWLNEYKIDTLNIANHFDLPAAAVQSKVLGAVVDFAIGREKAMEAGYCLKSLKKELQTVALVYHQVDGEVDTRDAFSVVMHYPFRAEELAEMLLLARRQKH